MEREDAGFRVANERITEMAEDVRKAEEAAWILKPTPRPMLRAGELEGHPSERLANFLENAVRAKFG